RKIGFLVIGDDDDRERHGERINRGKQQRKLPAGFRDRIPGHVSIVSRAAILLGLIGGEILAWLFWGSKLLLRRRTSGIAGRNRFQARDCGARAWALGTFPAARGFRQPF